MCIWLDPLLVAEDLVEIFHLGQGALGIIDAAFVSISLLCCGCVYCLVCGIPLHFLCRKHRQRVLMGQFAKRKEKQRAQLEKDEGCSLPVDNEVMQSPVIADDYIGGEADIVEANCHNSFSFEELVSIIHCTGTTTFFFDGKFDGRLFETLDTDKSGTVDVAEIIASRNNQSLQFTVLQANCPALSNLFRGTEAQIRSRLRRANLIKGYHDNEVQREAWDNFAEFNRNARLLYYKCKTLAMGKLYYGKGMEPGKRSRFPILDALAALKMPRGWLQDYKHHIFNSHPVISIFFGSSYSIFTVAQRVEILLIDFLMCTSLTLIQVYVMDMGFQSSSGSTADYLNNIWTTFFIVTIPQGYLQRFVNRIGAILMVGDGSARVSQSCCARYLSHLCQALAANVLVVVVWGSFAITYFVKWFVSQAEGSNVINYVVYNALIGYITSLVIPLLYEYNPSSDIFRFALFLIDVKKFRNHEASSAVGQRVAVFDRGSSTCRLQSERLSDLGTGLVERVYDSDEVVVVLDDPERATRYNDRVQKRRRCRCSKGISSCYKSCCCCCCCCHFWAHEGPPVPSEEGHVILKVVSLANIEICGEKVIIISPTQPQYDGEVATCNSFFGRRGLYEVTMASGELCYFPPDNVRSFSKSKSLSYSKETDIEMTIPEESSDNFAGGACKGGQMATYEESNKFDAEVATAVRPDHFISSRSEITSEPSWWSLLLRFDEPGLRRKARTRAATDTSAAMIFDAPSAAFEGIALPSKDSNGAPSAMSSMKTAAASISRARKTAAVAAEVAAKARARAQFEAERFARSWIGSTVGPLLGWFILDYWQVCAWRRERAAVLSIIRDAITEHGPEHMSDPHVHAKALLAREAAARVLQEGGTVRLRGPSVAESYEASHGIRESMASSNVALGRIVPGVPRGTLGVVVRGSGDDNTFLKANGFSYRHLTPDLRVHVLFSHGQRTLPADWLEAVHETFSETTTTASTSHASFRSPIRKWKQTLATREKRRAAQSGKNSDADHLDVKLTELTDRNISNRFGTYNAMHSRKEHLREHGGGAYPVAELHDFTAIDNE